MTPPGRNVEAIGGLKRSPVRRWPLEIQQAEVVEVRGRLEA
ncbi:hypothetical protein [Falsiroseomonas sp.]